MKKLATTLKRAIFAHKIPVLIISGVLVAAIGYSLWSKNQWETYQARYAGWQTEAKKDLDTVLALPSDTDMKRQEKRESIGKLSETLAGNQGMCTLNSLVAWQRFIKPLAEQETQCLAIKDKLVKLTQATEKLNSYLADQQAFVKVVSNAPSGGELSEGEWEAQINAWQKVLDQLKQLEVQADFSPIKDKAVEEVEKIKGAWQNVWSAHAAQNKEEYTKAQAGLANSYGTFAAVAAVDKAQFDKVIAALISSYESAF